MQLGKEGLSYLLLIKGFIVNPDMNIQWNLLTQPPKELVKMAVIYR